MLSKITICIIGSQMVGIKIEKKKKRFKIKLCNSQSQICKNYFKQNTCWHNTRGQPSTSSTVSWGNFALNVNRNET